MFSAAISNSVRRSATISRASNLGLLRSQIRCFSADLELRTEYTLNNGTTVPAVGLGSAGIMKKDPLVPAFTQAGYKLVDTASWNKNEGAVGDAI